MEQQINDLIKSLGELRGRLAEYGNLSTALDGLKAEHKSTSDALAKVKVDLATTQAGLSAAQLTNVKQLDETINAKQQELAGVLAHLDNAKSDLATLSAEVSSKQQAHQQLEDSLTSLKKRFG